MRALDVDDREPVVERHRLIELPVRQIAGGHVRAQAAAVGQRDLRIGMRGEHEIGEPVALRGLRAIDLRDRAGQRDTELLLAADVGARERLVDDLLHRRIGRHGLALVVPGLALVDRRGVVLLLAGAHRVRRIDVDGDHPTLRGHPDVDPAERATRRERFDDGDVVDPVCDAGMRVAGDEDVHGALRESTRNSSSC